MDKSNNSLPPEQCSYETVKLSVPADLYRAFQRCLWLQVNQSGRSQLEIMEEVVVDFLKKHGC